MCLYTYNYMYTYIEREKRFVYAYPIAISGNYVSYWQFLVAYCLSPAACRLLPVAY